MMMISYIKRMKTMRTLVDLGDTQVQALDELSKREKRSRAALIRLAIDEYLAKRHSKQEGDAFGLWGKRKVDGLVYQKKVRSEW
jgi:predicted transcriptional regulator